VTKSIDLDKIKERASELSISWKKKLSHFSSAVSRSGMDGVQHWFKSHHQIEELAEALEELNLASQESDFQLLQVHTTLSSFVLPEEDLGQAEWYATAHNLLDTFENNLTKENKLNKQLVQNLVKELKFISEADEFHQRYQLTNIQEEVKKLYQSLQKSLTEFKAQEKEKLKAQQESEKLKLAEQEAKKAEALAKKAMMENVKIKEKRLAIMEEKKRKIAEKEAIEEQRKLEEEQADQQTKRAEHDRQAKLQDAYVDLQIEERVSKWELSEHVSKLQSKLENDTLDSNDKAVLEAFLDFAKEKL